MAIISGSATKGNDSIIADQGADYIDALAGNDTVDSGGGADSVYGRAGNDFLLGGAQNDNLLGDGGNDFMTGGTGDDLLKGGNGNDKLIGELGRDSLYGGQGKDIFQIGDGNNSSNSNDTIYDFVDGTDKILLTNGLTFEDLTIDSRGFRGGLGTTISTSGGADLSGVIADLVGVDPALITSDDFSLA